MACSRSCQVWRKTFGFFNQCVGLGSWTHHALSLSPIPSLCLSTSLLPEALLQDSCLQNLDVHALDTLRATSTAFRAAAAVDDLWQVRADWRASSRTTRCVGPLPLPLPSSRTQFQITHPANTNTIVSSRSLRNAGRGNKAWRSFPCVMTPPSHGGTGMSRRRLTAVAPRFLAPASSSPCGLTSGSGALRTFCNPEPSDSTPTDGSTATRAQTCIMIGWVWISQRNPRVHCEFIGAPTLTKEVLLKRKCTFLV